VLSKNHSPKINKMKNSSKVLIAVGAGVAIGGLLGVLFAPDKGSETRKKIADAGKQLGEKIKEKVNEGKEKFSGMKEELKERINARNERVEELV
jgi:gas vesicle protein